MSIKSKDRMQVEPRVGIAPADRFPTAGRTPFFAVAGIVLAATFSALSIFWDLTGNDPEPEAHPLGQFAVVVGIIVVTTVALYALAVRTADRGNPGRRSLVLGVLAAASVILFWLGLPVVLASAAAATAFMQRDQRGRFGGTAAGGVTLAVITTLATAALAVMG